MNNLILSTKSKANPYRLMFIIYGIVGLIFCCIVFSVNADIPSYSRTDEMEMTYLLLLALCFCFALLAFLFAFVRCSGYIDVYNDHIEGKGLQGKGMKSFHIRKNQIKGVSRESYYLNLHTDLGEFKIICGKEISNKISAYINTHMLTNQ